LASARPCSSRRVSLRCQDSSLDARIRTLLPAAGRHRNHLHWVIDSAKSEGVINFHQDQGLHLSFKVGYLFVV
jgi:hypothetical protein